MTTLSKLGPLIDLHFDLLVDFLSDKICEKLSAVIIHTWERRKCDV